MPVGSWIALGLVAALSLASGAWLWVLLRRAASRAPLRAAPGSDLVLLAGLTFLGGAAWGSLAREVEEGVARHLFGNLGLAAIAAIALVLVAWRVASGDALGAGLRGVPRGARLGGLAALALLAPSLLIHWVVVQRLLDHQTLEEILQPTQKLLLGLDAGGLALMTVLLTVAVPFYEETVFRGLLQGGLERLLGRIVGPSPARVGAVLIASLLFTAVHPPQTWVPILVLSLALGALYATTRNLYVAVIAHGGHNLISILLLRYPELLPI